MHVYTVCGVYIHAKIKLAIMFIGHTSQPLTMSRTYFSATVGHTSQRTSQLFTYSRTYFSAIYLQ